MYLSAGVSMAIYFFTHKQSFKRFLYLPDQIVKVKGSKNEIKSQVLVLFIKCQILCFEKYHCSKFHFENKIYRFLNDHSKTLF